MNMLDTLPVDREALAVWSAGRNEPEWLAALRLEALSDAARLQLPKLDKTKIDRWNLDHYGEGASGTKPAARLLPNEFKERSQAAENVIVHYNTDAVYVRLSDELAAQGVIFTGLTEAVKRYPELVKEYLMKAVRKDENRLTALHAALWNGGVFLYVPKNVEAQASFQTIFYNDDPTVRFVPHVLIVAESNSALTYAEHRLSAHSDPITHNNIVEVYAKAGARVRFASVHELSESVTDLSYRRAVLDQDARIEWIIGEMNDGNVISDTASVMKGNGSSSDVKVICVGSGQQNIDVTTRAVHYGKHSDSAMATRGVMRERVTAILNGITKIEKGATKANGEQSEKVLMLSPQSRGDANPILLIDEDDVKAGHAASVGQVNPEHIYYLMSRGISKDEAERLIIYGFLDPVIAEVPVDEIRDQLRARVERKLGQ